MNFAQERLLSSDWQKCHIDEAQSEGIEQPECYLFVSQYNRVEWCMIEDEMAQLNDYLSTCEEALAKVPETLATELPINRQINEEMGVGSGMADMHYDEKYDEWKYNYEFLFPGMALMSLHIFTEKTLRWVAFGEERPSEPEAKGKSKISHYLDIISENYQADIPREFYSIIAKSNRVRNHFAHGSWKKIDDEVRQINLRDYFRTVGLLLESLEDAEERTVWSAPNTP